MCHAFFRTRISRFIALLPSAHPQNSGANLALLIQFSIFLPKKNYLLTIFEAKSGEMPIFAVKN